MSSAAFFPPGRQGVAGGPGARGPQGPVGPGLTWRGGLRMSQEEDGSYYQYEPNDLVEYAGSSYVVRQTFFAGDIIPEFTQDWDQYLEVAAHRGDVGVKGNPGAAGTPGQMGGVGLTGDRGPIGLPGSYQDWLDQGNVGTYDDFVAVITGPQGEIGPTGDPGTYAEWLSRGNSGTYTEFLDVIRGRKGDTGEAGTYAEWLAQGNSGSYAQFLDAIRGAKGETGLQGARGDKGDIGDIGPQGDPGAYVDWLAQGNSGSYAQFLATITGPQGIRGPSGFPGTYQEWLDTGHLGDYATFLNAIRGAKGDTGDDGQAGTYAEWINQGNNGSYDYFLSLLKGPRGDDGLPGPQGRQGQPGAAVYKGDQGPIGPPGPQGDSGERGVNWLGPWDPDYSYAKQDAVAFNGGSWICVSDAASTNQTPGFSGDWEPLAERGSVIGVKGPKGDKGDQGISGAPGGGTQQSVWGWNAADINAPLATGKVGVNDVAPASATEVWINKVGQLAGIDWSVTIDAMGAGDHVYMQAKGDAASWHRWTIVGDPVLNATTWVIPVVSDGGSPQGTEPADGADVLIAFQFSPLQGPVGPTGPAGAAGSQGIQGLQGATGAVGPTGPQGPIGAKGDTGPQGLQGATGGIGPTGPQGPAGIKGDTGLQGPQGTTGAVGPAGPEGPAGVKGDTGAQGPQGATGPQGPSGATGAGVVITTWAARPTAAAAGAGALALVTDLTDIQKFQVSDGTRWLRASDGVVSPNYSPTVTFTWTSDGDTNGLFYYLGTRDQASFVRPAPGSGSATAVAVGARVTITASSTFAAAGLTPGNLVDRGGSTNAEMWESTNVAGQWVMMDLLDHTFAPTRLSLRHYADASSSIINFVIEGSPDNSAWTNLLTVTAATAAASFAWRNWAISGASAYRYLRVRQTGLNAGGTNWLELSEWEWYGTLAPGYPLTF